jgi:signal transduction histidine kinase/CheY-like chemotaxis protein
MRGPALTVALVARAVIALLLFGTGRVGAETVVLDDTFSEQSLGRHLELGYDSTGQLSVDEVARGAVSFVPSEKDVPTFGYRKGAEWARVSIEDRREHRSTLRVENGYGQSDRLDLYEVIAGRVAHRSSAGDHVPLAEWPHVARTPAYDLEPAPSRTLYFRLDGGASHQLPLTLATASRSERRLLADAVAQALFYGAMLIMVGYNGLVAIATRSAAYALYVAFLCSNGILHLAYTGLLPPLGVTAPWVVDFTVPLTVSSTIGLSIFFTIELLGLRATAPILVRRLGWLAAGHAACVILSVPFGYSVAIRAALVGSVPWAAALIATAYRESTRGSRLGRLYLMAWVSFLLGAVAVGLRNFGILPVNGITNGASSIGAAVEFLLLSFALADRIKQLQAEVARNADLAREASERALAEQERTNAELQRLDALKDEFLANTSHELRTPLHGILGLTEGVLRSSTNIEPGNRDRLEMVVASGRRLASLVNDILDFSKLRHQELTLREKDVDLRGAVSLALSVVSPMAEAKSLALANDVPPGLVVRADENRLQQILTNLIGNAVKFTPAGSVRVFAALEGERMLVSVQDTGVGVSIEAQGRIFESFEQGDGSTAREFGGTGLGLAVTKKLVELHGGTVRVASAPGEGSTFTFDVAVASGAVVAPHAESGDVPRGSIALQAAPRASVTRTPTQDEASPSTPRAEARPPSSMRLLVADDDPVNLEVLRAQLEPEGHEVVTARDGQQAVDALYKHGPFDGVLLDVMMPVMTGPQAATRMRADYPHGTLPILMLTAKNRPEDVVAGLKAGADDYVGKPFHRDELIARLDVHLDASKTTRALERFVSPALVELAGEASPSALHPGQGRGRNVLVGRFAMHGLAEFAARLDESAFFRRINRVVQVLVEQVELHGGVVETMVDEGLCVLFEDDAASAMATMSHALRAARDVAGQDLQLGAVLHAGHVNVGVVGTAQWVSLRAMGESVLIAGALGRWGVARGFGVLVTDAVVGKLDERADLRRVGTARLGAQGHPVTLFEVQEPARDAGDLDAIVELLERGQFARVNEALASAVEADPLVRHLAAAAAASEREVALG